MSSAKRTLRRVIREWLGGSAAAPLLLRHCEVCGEKSWRPLSETVRGVTIDANLPGGKRADAILTDAQGEIDLVIQLEGGSKLQNRIEPRAGLPLVVLRAATLADEPQRWSTLREHGLPAWRCRCAGTRCLPVDDDFSLRVIGCPINLRTDGDAVLRARDRGLRALRIFRRHRLRRQRSPPHPASLRLRRAARRAAARGSSADVRPESASPNRGWIVTAGFDGAGHHPAMFDFDVLKISDVQPNDDGPRRFGLNMVRLDAQVTEIPRGPALTLSPETSIATAIDSMRRRLRGSAIVIQTHRPLGVVCDRDILAQACGDIDDLRAVRSRPSWSRASTRCARTTRSARRCARCAGIASGTCRSCAGEACSWARSTSPISRSGCAIA